MKKIKILLMLILLCTTLNFAQNSKIDSLVNAGIALHDNGKYLDAIEKYKMALQIDSTSSLINYEISYSYLSAEDYKNAEKYSKKVIEANDKNMLPAYITYGSALDMQGKSNEAIKVYEIAMKQFDNYLLYYNYALSCFNMGNINKAYTSIIEAVKSNPSHASSHLLLSKIVEQSGVKIKTILPLYFSLLIEPNSQRADGAYKTLREYLSQGITQTTDKITDITLPTNNDSTFSSVELMLSLVVASKSLDENKEKSDLQLFAETNETIFKILGELKENNTGFWWDFYVPFLYDLANANLTEVYSYYISQTQRKEARKWLDEHPDELKKLGDWVNGE